LAMCSYSSSGGVGFPIEYNGIEKQDRDDGLVILTI